MLYLMLVIVFSKLSKKWWLFLIIGWGSLYNIFALHLYLYNTYIPFSIMLYYIILHVGMQGSQ